MKKFIIAILLLTIVIACKKEKNEDSNVYVLEVQFGLVNVHFGEFVEIRSEGKTIRYNNVKNGINTVRHVVTKKGVELELFNDEGKYLAATYYE